MSPARLLQQHVGYVVRHLADIAVKALSPSVNDSTTATTCLRYPQPILERLAVSPVPAAVRRFHEQDVTMVMRDEPFSDQVDALVESSRYASDARVVDALLRAALRVAQAAEEAGAPAHVHAATDAGARIARRAFRSDALDEDERKRLREVLSRFPPPLFGRYDDDLRRREAGAEARMAAIAPCPRDAGDVVLAQRQ